MDDTTFQQQQRSREGVYGYLASTYGLSALEENEKKREEACLSLRVPFDLSRSSELSDDDDSLTLMDQYFARNVPAAEVEQGAEVELQTQEGAGEFMRRILRWRKKFDKKSVTERLLENPVDVPFPTHIRPFEPVVLTAQAILATPTITGKKRLPVPKKMADLFREKGRYYVTSKLSCSPYVGPKVDQDRVLRSKPTYTEEEVAHAKAFRNGLIKNLSARSASRPAFGEEKQWEDWKTKELARQAALPRRFSPPLFPAHPPRLPDIQPVTYGDLIGNTLKESVKGAEMGSTGPANLNHISPETVLDMVKTIGVEMLDLNSNSWENPLALSLLDEWDDISYEPLTPSSKAFQTTPRSSRSARSVLDLDVLSSITPPRHHTKKMPWDERHSLEPAVMPYKHSSSQRHPNHIRNPYSQRVTRGDYPPLSSQTEDYGCLPLERKALADTTTLGPLYARTNASRGETTNDINHYPVKLEPPRIEPNDHTAFFAPIPQESEPSIDTHTPRFDDRSYAYDISAQYLPVAASEDSQERYPCQYPPSKQDPNFSTTQQTRPISDRIQIIRYSSGYDDGANHAPQHTVHDRGPRSNEMDHIGKKRKIETRNRESKPSLEDIIKKKSAKLLDRDKNVNIDFSDARIGASQFFQLRLREDFNPGVTSREETPREGDMAEPILHSSQTVVELQPPPKLGDWRANTAIRNPLWYLKLVDKPVTGDGKVTVLAGIATLQSRSLTRSLRAHFDLAEREESIQGADLVLSASTGVVFRKMEDIEDESRTVLQTIKDALAFFRRIILVFEVVNYASKEQGDANQELQSPLSPAVLKALPAFRRAAAVMIDGVDITGTLDVVSALNGPGEVATVLRNVVENEFGILKSALGDEEAWDACEGRQWLHTEENPEAKAMIKNYQLNSFATLYILHNMSSFHRFAFDLSADQRLRAFGAVVGDEYVKKFNEILAERLASSAEAMRAPSSSPDPIARIPHDHSADWGPNM